MKNHSQEECDVGNKPKRDCRDHIREKLGFGFRCGTPHGLILVSGWSGARCRSVSRAHHIAKISAMSTLNLTDAKRRQLR